MTDKNESYQEERRRKRASIAGWFLFILSLAVALFFLGPCDPAPEPIPAGPQATTGGVEGSPGESSSASTAESEVTGDDLGASSSTTGR